MFSLSLLLILSTEVKAAQVCCELTTAGDSCQYINKDDCALGSLKAATTCEQTSFCQLGCGISTEEGLCFENTPKATTITQNLTWVEDPTCDIPQCQKGCCVLNNQYSFVTQARCKKETSAFPDLTLDFREEIKTEQACLEESLAQEEGCCAIDQNTCNFGTRAECLELSGGDASKFKKDTFCSNEKLTCECTPRHHLGCLPGKEDIYWFDSCGNPEEVFDTSQTYTGFAQDPTCTASLNDPNCGNCDYSLGTVCGAVDTPNEFACVSVNCDTTTIDPNTPGTGGPRKNGESWCVFDDTKTPGADTAGSRYHRYSCINGKEIKEHCADYRQEFCIQGEKLTEAGRFSEAKCKVNNYESCAPIDNEDDCESELLDCQWLTNKCIPLVSPGEKFWEETSADQCSQGSDTGKFVYDEDDKPNSRINEWVVQKAAQCRALGDCGENVNFLGVEGEGGFENSEGIRTKDKADNLWDSLGGRENLLGYGLSIVTLLLSPQIGLDIPLLFGAERLIGKGWIWNTEKKSGFWDAEVGKVSDAKPITGDYYTSSKGDKTLIVNQDKDVYQMDTSTYKELKEKGGFGAFDEPDNFEGYEDVDHIGKGFDTEDNSYTKPGTGISVGEVISLAITAYVLYTIINALVNPDEDVKESTVTVTCSPWQAPVGGSDCEKCDDDPNKPCTEYRCKSLGQLCELINAGTGNETCVSMSPLDSTSPLITPSEGSLQKGNTVTETIFPGGFEGFKINEILEPFTPISFGILTDEPAQCKISTEQGIAYDNMKEVYFGNNFFTIEHRIALNIPLDTATADLSIQNDGLYTLYVRCQDKAGNANEKDYFIQFQVKAGPDLEPPIIEATSLPPNAQIPYDTTTTLYSVFLNEPAECRYAFSDKDYDQMTNNFECASTISPIFYGLYECKTNLTGLDPEQDNIIYTRCRDQPTAELTDRNTNSESHIQVLKPSDPLTIVSTSPSGPIYQDSVILEVKTADGAERDGTAQCGFSKTQSNFILFSQTNASIHTQSLVNLPKASYIYYVQCIDLANNVVSDTIEFEISVDNNPPKIVNLYKDMTTATHLLHLVTDEPSTCEYSTTGKFNPGQGKLMTGTNVAEHDAVLDSEIYYIRCKDTADNQMSLITLYL